MKRIRAFISIDVEDKHILDKILEIQHSILKVKCRIKFVEPENIHLTLKFLGEIPVSMVDEIVKVMEKATISPFTIEIKGVGAFPHNRRARVIWIGVGKGSDRVCEIFRRLDIGLRSLGFISERKSFIPHITIGRVKGGCDFQRLEKILNNFTFFQFGEIFVDNIRLKKSVLTPKGPIYTTLREVELAEVR